MVHAKKKGRPLGWTKAATKVTPWRYCAKPGEDGPRRLDLRLAPGTKTAYGGWAQAEVSRHKLERAVFGDDDWGENAGGVIPSGERSRLWNGLHKEYKESWKDNKDDYVPVAVALWFCCAAVAAEDCCDDVLRVAASLLVACTPYGVEASGKVKRDVTFTIEVDSRYGVEVDKDGRPKNNCAGKPILIEGTLPARVWEAAMLLSTDCAAPLIKQMGGDKLAEKVHCQLGELGAKVIYRSQKRLSDRRAAERKRAGGSAAAASGKVSSGRSVKHTPPQKLVKDKVPPAHLIKQAHLTARARKEAEEAGIIAMPEAEYQRKLDTVWKTAREDLIGSLPTAQLLALEARISMACVEKIVRTFGAGMSLRSQQRLAKFESLDTFIDTEATRNQTVNQAAEERDATASAAGAAQSARETTETKRVKAALGNNCGAVIAGHANKLLKDFQSEFDAVEEEFANHAARRGFWTRLAAVPTLAAAWDSRETYKKDKERGQILKSLLEEHFNCKFKKEYQFHGRARTMTVSVPASQIPVSKKQQIRSEFGSRTFGGDDDGVELNMKMPDMTKGIATLDDVNVVCGGVHRVPESVRTGHACTKEDITFANLKEENSPFHDGFRQQCADEAVARGIGAWKESESSSTPQLGSYIKVTTPALQKEAARLETESGERIVGVRNPDEIVRTHVSRLALNHGLNPLMTRPDRRPAEFDERPADYIPTLILRAVLSPDHQDVFKRSVGVAQIVFLPEMSDDTTKRFFDGVEREKVQHAMGAVSYPLYLVFGLAEGGDGYANVEAPLLGVAREMLFMKTHEIKGNGFHFNVRIEHAGCGSLTADEKARCLALGRTGGGADVFSFADAEAAGYMCYEHLSTSKMITVEYLWQAAADYENTENIMDPKVFAEWKRKYPGFDRPCGQISGKETMVELEQKCGSRKAPMGAMEGVHCLADPASKIFASVETVKGEEAQAKLKANLDSFVSGACWKDTLGADKSQVLKIASDPKAAFGDQPLQSGWEEFQYLMFLTMEIFCLLVIEEPTAQDEMAMWVNTFCYYALTIDLVEMGFWEKEQKHSPINKYLIQLGYFCAYQYGIPGPNREHKVRARDFLCQVQEHFMIYTRRAAKQFSNHGGGSAGGFDETNPLESMFLRYDCECLFRFFGGASTSHSVTSRSNSYLKAHRDGKACGHDCFIPAALLEKGRAAERFLPQFKLNLATELNEDGSKRFVWGRHIFEAAGVGIIGLTVTPVPATARPATQMSALPYKLPSKAVDLVLDFKLKCAWRLEKRIVISDDNTVRWEITKEVRRSVPGGCMVKLSHPKPSGESVGKDKVLYPCAKHWHDTEAAFTKDKQHGWTDKKLKAAKKKRTAKAGTTSTAVSGLRTAELQVEFIRLRAEYLRKPSMPVPPALPVPLDTLTAEVTTSFDEAGDDHEWPAEYSQVLTAKQAEAAAAAVDMDLEEAGANASYNRSLGRLREETAAILEAHRYPPAVEAGRSQRRGTGRDYSAMNSGL